MKLYYWYIAIIGIAWPSTQLITMHHNQSLDDVSIEKSALFGQLIAQTAAGNYTAVSASLTKHPEFVLYRHDGNTLITIAAHHRQLNIAFLLLKKNAAINWLEYQALWAELSKEPRSHATKSILSFITLLRSSGYYYYHQSLKKIPDLMLESRIQQYITPQVPSWIQTFTAPRFRIPHIPYISGGLSFLVTYFKGGARKAEQLLYAAALDNNWSALQILLQQYASHLRPETYCRAASYGCYVDGNPYLALYILCHRLKRQSDHPLFPFIGGLIDIFYQKSAVDC